MVGVMGCLSRRWDEMADDFGIFLGSVNFGGRISGWIGFRDIPAQPKKADEILDPRATFCRPALVGSERRCGFDARGFAPPTGTERMDSNRLSGGEVVQSARRPRLADSSCPAGEFTSETAVPRIETMRGHFGGGKAP